MLIENDYRVYYCRCYREDLLKLLNDYILEYTIQNIPNLFNGSMN